RADEHADGNGRRLHADHSSGQPLGTSSAPRRGVPVRARGPRLRPASGLRRRDHRHLSLDAASRGEALRVGGRRRHLHTAEHHPPAFQCQRRQARAPDLGHQPDLQGLRAERPGAARGRAGVRPGRHSVRGAGWAVSLCWVGFPDLLIRFTHSYAMLRACIALVGFGNSIWHPTAIPTLGQRYPERKGLVLSLHGMGGNVGDAVAPLVIGALLALFSWRQVVVMNVLPGLVVAVLILVLLGTLQFGTKHVERQSLAEYLRGLEGLFRNRALVLLSAGSSFRTMTQAALLTFLPVFLAREMGYSPALVGACLFALQAAGFAAAPVAGHLSDRMGRKRILL